MNVASPGIGTSPRDMLHACVADLHGATLDECSTLPTSRFDSKFVAQVSALGALVQTLHASSSGGQSWRVLEVEHHRIVQYQTAYFDTPCLQLYRDHLQGRRRRFKIRTRRYSTGAHVLEIKLKGICGKTEKLRRTRANGARRMVLDHAEHDWLLDSLQTQFAYPAPLELSPSAQTFYRRICLVGPDDDRLTIDLDFAVAQGCNSPQGAADQQIAVNPDLAIVESKSSRMRTDLDRQLRQIARHPDQLSKYAIALAMTRGVRCNPWLPALRRLNGEPAADRHGMRGHV
ncbi:MAG: VTC domain-containing protein [Rhodobacteraceae bacterium]|nr:VTC domain-containing protein [Paracoccaceae bacterium]TVR49041.1 MAG: VTC domain-containing protein [Paracoccaceae bacterium]